MSKSRSSSYRPKDAFFKKMDRYVGALSYADALLETGYSEVMPDNVDIQSRFSRRVPVKIPIASAAMDTITESKMAIALAKLGGIGIIHRNLSSDEQAREVTRVKHELNGLIQKPICVFADETIRQVLRKRAEKGWKFHTFPVIDRAGNIIGILTKNDFDFCDNTASAVSQMMTPGLVVAKRSTNIQEAYELMNSSKKKVLPLTKDGSPNGQICGMYVFQDVKRVISGDSHTCNIDGRGQLRVGAAIGVSRDDFSRAEKLVAENVDVLVIDTAHADTKGVIDALRTLKKVYPDVDIVVGNISNPKSIKRLIDAGADGIKVGQGPGSICKTRIVAGIGTPQLTAVYECAKASRGYDVPIIADGGLCYSGDIPKALGAGAHCVMLGNMLAGTEEAPGDTVTYRNQQWKSYRGMGSLEALKDNAGSRERYNQTTPTSSGKSTLIAEGVTGLVPHKGPLRDVIFQYIGGLRAGMGYVGAATIAELEAKASFIRITSEGSRESHPHDVVINVEAPNYSSSR